MNTLRGHSQITHTDKIFVPLLDFPNLFPSPLKVRTIGKGWSKDERGSLL